MTAKRNRVTKDQGRPAKRKELKESLYEFFLYVARTRAGRCSGTLLRSKLLALLRANEDEYPEAVGDGNVSPEWASKRLCASMAEYGLRYRQKIRTVRATGAELQRRAGCYWRNVIRFRVWCDDKCAFDAFDRTPFDGRMDDGKLVAEAG